MKRLFEENSEELRARVMGLGEQAAHKSYYPELQARLSELERALNGLHLLSEVGLALFSSFDWRVTLPRALQLAGPYFGHFGALFERRQGGGRVTALACYCEHARDLAKNELACRHCNTGHVLFEFAVAAMESGRPVVVPGGDHVPESRPADSVEMERLQHLGLTSLLALPLGSGDQAFGALLLASEDPRRPYGAAELEVGRELARRMTLAHDHAELYVAAQNGARVRDEFVALVSHELRTPLTAVLGWARMLASGEVDAERTPRALTTIERNATALSQIIDDLLDVSRMMADKLQLRLAPTDLSVVAEAAAEAQRPVAEAKGLSLSVSRAKDLPLVLGDAARLQQVVANLLANAIKFTPPQGRITVEVESSARGVELVVTDTGRGIAPEFLPHVFERFSQAADPMRRARGGLGLGLAIVHYLVEHHGGQVEATSAGYGRGARFTVRLPELRALPALRAAPVPASHPEGVSQVQSLAGVRVLTVEDDPDGRELLVTVLRDAGASVIAASTVDEGLDLVERTHPDVLLSDLVMPNRDGYDLIRELRKRGHRQPCAAVTAMAREEERARVLAAGFDCHIAKPVDPAELLRTISHLAATGPRQPERVHPRN